MANASPLAAPQISAAQTDSGTTIGQLSQFLVDRNEFLLSENEQLLEASQRLETCIAYKESIVRWQHRLISLGEEHIKILRAIIQEEPQQASPVVPHSPAQNPEFRHKPCSSPLETPPGMLHQESEAIGDESLVPVAPWHYEEQVYEDDWPITNNEVVQQDDTYVVSYGQAI
ncbi:hypothetical protein FALBO_5243 [Fusarium albosuccineum]|uniref:Uncharacterized protein n=1 Tax=Fusarium albosuccineum TaxID=1237068 RepID=A0A8H4LGU7_9HYPO|nr:hypothetical protein FALBO_5243 [Fusarium albosuccineum]